MAIDGFEARHSERRAVKKPREGYCHASVWHPMVIWGTHGQCSKKIKYDGKWCGIHRDEAILRRREKKEERYRGWRSGLERDIKLGKRSRARARAFDNLVQCLRDIAQGHNDPRSHAQAALDGIDHDAFRDGVSGELMEALPKGE